MRKSDVIFSNTFWDNVKIEITGCWFWTGGDVEDRGFTSYGRWQNSTAKLIGTRRVHRLAWFLTFGWLPKKPLQVNHSCNEGLCVRPDHLYVGTQYDNIQDQIARGTHTKASIPGSIPSKKEN